MPEMSWHLLFGRVCAKAHSEVGQPLTSGHKMHSGYKYLMTENDNDNRVRVKSWYCTIDTAFTRLELSNPVEDGPLEL